MKRHPDGTPRRRGIAREEHAVIEVSADRKSRKHRGDFESKVEATKQARALRRKVGTGATLVVVHADTWHNGEWIGGRSE